LTGLEVADGGNQTTPFNDPDLWPEDKTQQPFVWSTTDEYVDSLLSHEEMMLTRI